MTSQGPIEIMFVEWPKQDGDSEDEDASEDEEKCKFYDQPEAGSLHETLNGIETERIKTADQAVNAHMREKGIVSSHEIREIIDKTSKPFEKKAEEARDNVVKKKSMTAEEERVS